ncbi:inner-membrane translocator [Salipaludibacillus keqinensis]|uniref:Inner-membrane translocator n=1 Tax=Salipaludibacillus keqinensis TaxID=2045207 RepID=A0A323TIN2_9BACI|nr:inner-membrane translocator [Salipaludibacillus keqinensis]PYZ94771.1 inner-membrane translocator [Salipaludibacillus keqinensis]
MDSLILILFFLVLISLKIMIFILFGKGKLNLMIAGIMMMLLAPVLGYLSGASLLYFYDWSAGGTGEGAGYGGALLGFLALGNGLLILGIGIIRWIITTFITKGT